MVRRIKRTCTEYAPCTRFFWSPSIVYSEPSASQLSSTSHILCLSQNSLTAFTLNGLPVRVMRNHYSFRFSFNIGLFKFCYVYIKARKTDINKYWYCSILNNRVNCSWKTSSHSNNLITPLYTLFT